MTSLGSTTLGSAMKKIDTHGFLPYLFYVVGHTKVFLYVPQNLINLSLSGWNCRRYIHTSRKNVYFTEGATIFGIFIPGS